MIKTSLADSQASSLARALRAAHGAVAIRYPGTVGNDAAGRQPIHTVYGGAHLFRADTTEKLGQLALRALDAYGGEPAEFARAVGLSCDDRGAHTLIERVRHKLVREPVEDYRIDFEDGYGHRPDSEEDEHAVACAHEVARAHKSGTLSPFHGIRIKPLSAELCRRSLRTLDIFLTNLASESQGIPATFYVTLPKIHHRDQVAVLADALTAIEKATGLAERSIPIELMIETTQSILATDGNSALLGLLDAAGGRCTGAHFGTYDYTASCGITAAHQHMTHPACDFARHMMQVAYAGTGIFLSDGATNIMPVAPHKPAPGRPLTDDEIDDNRATVHAAWRLHVDHIRHSLVHGYYQGWDLHPAQLPTRYAAVYDFFRSGAAAASQRLRNFIEVAAQATLVGDVFDDAATGQGLLNFFVRGINCGAISEEEAVETGLSLDEIRGRSFVKILENRRQGR